MGGSATIDVAEDKTLTYEGASLSLGANTLTVAGAGTLSNPGGYDLGDPESVMKLTGTNTVSGPLSLNAGIIDVDESTILNSLTLGAVSYTHLTLPTILLV